MLKKAADPIYELAELCHLFFCQKPHAKDMAQMADRDSSLCFFNLESTLDSRWECEDHQKMMQLALLKMEEYEVKDVTELLALLDEVVESCRVLNSVISKHPAMLQLVERLIG